MKDYVNSGNMVIIPNLCTAIPIKILKGLFVELDKWIQNFIRKSSKKSLRKF